MKNPLVSIIVPCYNQAIYLDECIESVLNQTYNNWECIIINDGSSDDTESVAKEWQKKDSRIKYISRENGGLSNARNMAIDFAKGEFILPLDADDKIGIDYLKLAINEFQKDKFLKVVYCKAEKFGAKQEEWNLLDFSLESLASDNVIFCSAFYRKKDWESVNGYDINMIHGLEDWEYWIALLKNKGKVVKLNYVGFYYRIKENSMIKDIADDNKKKMIEYITIKHADFFVAQKGSFAALENEIKLLKRESFKNISSKKIAVKVFLKAFFKLDFFK